MKHEELYNKIIDRFAWWEIEEENKEDLHKALETEDKKYLLDVLNYFKTELYESEEKDDKDFEIIEELENIIGLKIEKI